MGSFRQCLDRLTVEHFKKKFQTRKKCQKLKERKFLSRNVPSATLTKREARPSRDPHSMAPSVAQLGPLISADTLTPSKEPVLYGIALLSTNGSPTLKRWFPALKWFSLDSRRRLTVRISSPSSKRTASNKPAQSALFIRTIKTVCPSVSLAFSNNPQ